MASLNRQLRRENNKPKKTLIGVYGGYNSTTLLVDGDILLVFADETDLQTYLAKSPKFPVPQHIKPMYFEDMMQGCAMGGRYGLRRPVSQKFLGEWVKKYKENPPFSLHEVDENVDFISLTANK